MTKYNAGIGYGSDLEQTDITASGYPVLKPGYFYIGNEEYYAFSNPQVVLLDTISASGLEYIPGTPYFVIESQGDLEVVKNMTILADADTVDFEPGVSGVWRADSDNTYEFENWGLSGKYLIYDSLTENAVYTKVIQNGMLVLSAVDTGDPYEIDLNVVGLSSANVGMPVDVRATVYDENGALLSNETVEWWKVYDDQYGVAQSGVISSRVTDEYGNSFVTINPRPNEYDLFVYAKSGTARSKLQWIQINISASVPSSVFLMDDEDVIWSSRECMTAVGLDAWCELWDANSNAEYEDIITGNSDYPTRGDWKTGFAKYQRPPMTAASGVNEALGYWNGEDFADAYLAGSGVDVWNNAAPETGFMYDQRCAVQGYWGQVLVSSADLIADYGTGAGLMEFYNNCLNKTENQYTIYYRDTISVSGDISVWAHDGYFGYTGSYDDVVSNAFFDQELFFVLYAPGYTGNDPEYFKTNNFYFRGLAVGSTETPGSYEQDFTLGELISLAHIL